MAEDVLDLVGEQARVDGDEDAARGRNAEVGLEQLGRVQRQDATRSPFSIPASCNATASRRERSRSSAQVSCRSPSVTAIVCGNTAAERSRNASGVSGERWTGAAMAYPRVIVTLTASDTAFRNLLLDRGGPAATITLNRPEKRNALSLELMEELIAALELVGGEPGCARS